MRTTVNRKALLDALSKAKVLIPASTRKDLLKCVRIAADGRKVAITATDLEVSLRQEIDCDGVMPPLLINCDALAKRLRASKEEYVELRWVQNGQLMQALVGKVDHSLPSQDVLSYPIFRDVPVKGIGSAHTDGAKLRRAVEITSVAMATENTRYALNGLLVELLKAGPRFVATDGRRAVLADVPTVAGKPCEASGEAIIPPRMVKLVSKMIGRKDEVRVRVSVKMKDEGQGQGDDTKATAPFGHGHGAESVWIEGPGWTLHALAMDSAVFPAYRDIIPAKGSQWWLERDDMVETAKQVALATCDSNKGVYLKFHDAGVLLHAGSNGTESCGTVSGGHYDGPNRVTHTGVNPVFFLDALKTIDTGRLVIGMNPNAEGKGEVKNHCPLVLTEMMSDPEGVALKWIIMPVNVDTVKPAGVTIETETETEADDTETVAA